MIPFVGRPRRSRSSKPKGCRAGWLCGVCLLLAGRAFAASVSELPTRLAAESLSLDGTWAFKYVPGLDAGADEAFSRPGFDASSWSMLKVPAHWEMHGFSEPGYFDGAAEGLGLYRRTFRVPAAWRGRRVFICFDGVLPGFTAWVNGKEVGSWASGFNPVTFDVTDALSEGDADNILAVRVTTRSHGWEFDTMDCWSLSGIYRDVTLFAVPAKHITDYTARTTLRRDGDVDLWVEARATAPGTVAAQLTAPDGNTSQTFDFAVGADGRGETTVRVARPQLWTAESPFLYRLDLTLRPPAEPTAPGHRLTDRIGLRQVTIEDGVLKLNGRPIKLRGINHHDIWPEEGRVATVDRMKRDLELMREANINFIRTAHYPPHPSFIGMCDEMGFYVDCEVPFIHGRDHLADPAYLEDLFTRARATVARDKNHPSIIFWSVGNENPVNEQGLQAGRLVKELDPTRPIAFPTVGSHFKSNWEKYPEFVDIYTPHYAGPEKVREYAGMLKRPIIITEYAHQRGIARAGDGAQDIWDAMLSNPRVAGGAVWLFQDQGILRTAKDMAGVENGDLMVWLDEHRYFDTHGYYGGDGIVFSDRTRQADFWQLRRAYCPVQIRERRLSVKPGDQTVTLTVSNRYDFRSLDGMKLAWELRRNGTGVSQGEAHLSVGPHDKQKIPLALSIPADVAADVFTLAYRCLDEQGRSLTERSIRLDTGVDGNARRQLVERSLPAEEPALHVDAGVIRVTMPRWLLVLDRQTGGLTLRTPDGTPLLDAFGPHAGRKPTITELGKKREGERTSWAGELIREVVQPVTAAERTPEGVRLTVQGRYPRPGFTDQAVEGVCRFDVRPSGAIDVSYEYRSINAQGVMLETGLAFAMPAALAEFRWIGNGPFAGYPGRDLVSEFGVHHLHREDIFFPGNRRGVEFACLTDSVGRGVLFAGDDTTITVEHRGPETLVAQVASGSVNFDKKAKDGEKPDGTGIEEAKSRPSVTISGSLTIIPLAGGWPEPLTRWLGPATSRSEAFRPFLRVYDQ